MADQALSLEQLQDAIDRAAAVWHLDAGLRVISANDRLGRMVGIEAARLAGKDFFELLEPTSIPAVRESWSTQLPRGIAWRGELQFASQGRGSRWVEATVVPLATVPATFYALAFDVTERKSVERALEASRRFSNTLMELAPVGVMLADAQGDCTYVNDRWSVVSGLSFARAVGQSWLRSVHDDDRERVARAWREAVGSRRAYHDEFRYMTEAGAVHSVTIEAIPIDDGAEGSMRFLRIEQDETERHRQARVIEDQQATMANAAKLSALGEMAAGIAHELNSPLATISVRAGMLQERLQNGVTDSNLLLPDVAAIERTAFRLSDLIKSMRAISREAGQDPFVLTPVRTLLAEVHAFCSARYHTAGVSLEISPLAGDPQIWARPIQISQLLINLLNNAFDAANASRDKWVRIAVTIDENNVAFRISDSGIGIDPALTERIFEPFFTTKPVGSGTGLGLSVSRTIAVQHGGTLMLESGDATSFLFVVPNASTKTTQQPESVA